MPRTRIKALSTAFSKLSAAGRLKAEIDLLKTCSSDTVYRLRYDTMQYDYISPSVLDLLGYTFEEISQINLRSLIIETRIIGEGMRVVDSYAPLEESRKRGEVRKWQADYLMRTKDGRKIWVSDISYPWFDENGSIIGSKGALRDITERINAEFKIRNELTRQDYSDRLTGLANMRAFWLRMDEEVKRSRRSKSYLTLILMQVDKIEDIRKQYDAKMAEDVIVAIAKLIRNQLREIDIVARVEEDTFAILLPDTPAQGASVAAKRLAAHISQQNFLAQPPAENACPLAFGVAELKNEPAMDTQALYKEAGAQLLEEKCRSGNNRITAETETA